LGRVALEAPIAVGEAENSILTWFYFGEFAVEGDRFVSRNVVVEYSVLPLHQDDTFLMAFIRRFPRSVTPDIPIASRLVKRRKRKCHLTRFLTYKGKEAPPEFPLRTAATD